METLTLNDGTVLAGHAVLDGDTLWFYLDSIAFGDAYTLMSDQSKTIRIKADQYGMGIIYNGYTDLFCLRKEKNGQVTGGLNKA